MSSFYRATTVAQNTSRGYPSVFPPSVDLEALGKSRRVKSETLTPELSIYAFAHNCRREEATCAILHSGTHSCRETLLYSLHRSLSEISKHSYLSKAQVFVEYLQEGSSKLSDSHIEKILKFGEVFLESRRNIDEFSVAKTASNSIVLTMYEDSERSMTALCVLSMILWIFRNQNILDDVLEKFSSGKKSYLKPLFQYMAVRFLEESGWGDMSNQNLYMSVFCYFVSTGEVLRQNYKWFVNGPESAGKMGIPVESLVGYIKNIYAESGYGLNFGKIPNRVSTTSDFYILANLLLGSES